MAAPDRLTDEQIAELERLGLFNGETGECARCRATMSAPLGYEPTAVCDPCAQEIVADLLPLALAEVRASRAAERATEET